MSFKPQSRGLAIASGILRGINNAQTSIEQTNLAKQKLNMEKEKHDIDMKSEKAKLAYHEKYFAGPNDPQVLKQKQDMKALDNKAKADYDFANIAQSTVINQNKQKIGKGKELLQQGAKQFAKDQGYYKQRTSGITGEKRMIPMNQRDIEIEKLKERQELNSDLREKMVMKGIDPRKFDLSTTEGQVAAGKALSGSASIDTAEGLTNQQQKEARIYVAKKFGKKQGAMEFNLPIIYDEMRQGKSIDQIEDEDRFSGQSEGFVGAPRNAVQSIMINTTSEKTQNALDYIDDLWSNGDEDGAKNQMKRLARTQAGTEESKQISGKERTFEFLAEIQEELDTLEEAGIDTNIFTGTEKKIRNAVGTIKDEKLNKVAQKIELAIINYRKSMSGVAFSEPENKQYKSVFPSASKTANFNRSNINALREVIQGDLKSFYSLSMGRGAYNKLFGDDGEDQVRPTIEQITKAEELGAVGYDSEKGVYVDAEGNEVA